MSQVILYGAPLSLYTGRPRSYLIKAAIPYREQIPNTQHYVDTVLPLAGGRQSMPTLELPDGSVIRDGVAIVDHFEAANDFPFRPSTPCQRAVSLLFDVIGAEGLLRPAMHYRWNYPENLALLKYHFTAAMPAVPQREQMAEKTMNRMRAAGQAFGAVEDTFELLESVYADLLERLDRHFAQHPYLLGGRPAVGDFGLIAPMYGHLGRDPAPLAILQRGHINVLRWVERMNRPEPDCGEFADSTEDYLARDEVPDTLVEVLKHLALDFVPETEAAAAAINRWLAEQQSLESGTEVVRGVGMCGFELKGQPVNALAQPFRFYLLKRVQDYVDGLPAAEQNAVRTLFERCSMSSLLSCTIDRAIGRSNNLEVWL